jgi:hypothetical protein
MPPTEQDRQNMRQDIAEEAEARARGVYIPTHYSEKNARLQRKLLLIATIARNVAQTPIRTKRLSGDGKTMVPNEDVVGHEEATYRDLVAACVNGDDLEAER